MRELFPSNAFVSPQLPNPGKDLVRLVVAEAPGQTEAETGQPLVGGSGQVFNKLCRLAGIDRDGLTIINTIQCQPPSNLYPTDPAARSYISKTDADSAVKQCLRNHVLPIVKSRQWARVDLLGDKALHWLTGKTGITKWRGSPVEVDTEEFEYRVRS